LLSFILRPFLSRSGEMLSIPDPRSQKCARGRLKSGVFADLFSDRHVFQLFHLPRCHILRL